MGRRDADYFDFDDRVVRPCEADFCPEAVLEPRLFCPTCWDALPRFLKRDLYDAVSCGEKKQVDRLVEQAVSWLGPRHAPVAVGA